MNGANADESFKNVRHGYKSKGLRRIRREVDVRYRHGIGSGARRNSILPDPRLGPTIDVRSDIVLG